MGVGEAWRCLVRAELRGLGGVNVGRKDKRIFFPAVWSYCDVLWKAIACRNAPWSLAVRTQGCGSAALGILMPRRPDAGSRLGF